LRICITYHFQ